MFKGFKLDFTEGVNLVCGQNGIGKSSILELMHSLVGFLATPETSDHVNYSVMEAFPYETFCRWAVDPMGYGDMTIKIILDEEGDAFSYTLTVRFNFRYNQIRVHHESLVLLSDGEVKTLLSFSEGIISMATDDNGDLSFNGDQNVSGLITGARNNSLVQKFVTMIAKVYNLHLNPAVIAQDFKTGTKTLGAKGERFASWHFSNFTNDAEKQVSTTKLFKSFIPGLSNVNCPPSGDFFRWKVRVKYNDKFYDLELRELSDGQKILFVLYSLLANVPDGSTLIIDEPENYLAPGELQPWLDAVNDAWEERDIQFILITHNPKTINWYHKEALVFGIEGEPPRIVAELNSNNTSETLFDRLSEMEWKNNGS